MTKHKLSFSSDVRWVVEEAGIIVLKAGTSIALPPAESVLWALLEGRQDVGTLTEMLKAILDWDQPSARTWINDRVSEWLEAGYLVREPLDG